MPTVALLLLPLIVLLMVAIADPLFVDASKDDYRLKGNSPAFKLGFKRLPVEKIGPEGLE